MKQSVALLVTVLSACMSPVMHFGGGKTAKEAQQQRWTELMPSPLVPTGQWTDPVQDAKVRVWADDEYRAQNVGWEHVFAQQLEDANEILGPTLGIRLVADYRVWHRHAPGSSLPDDLAALAQQDPGDGVLTVIGLTSSLGLVSSTFEQLGLAQLGGNHMMLRGYADLEERKAFERYFTKLGTDERAELSEARRHHKTTSLLLHELGHNLGLPHADGATAEAIMNPVYSTHAASFSDAERQRMLADLVGRIKGRREAPPQLTASAVPSPGAAAGDVHPASAVPSPGAAAGDAHPAGAEGPGPLPPAVTAQLQHGEELLVEGQFADAMAIVEPLLAAYPGRAEPRILGCKIELERGGPTAPRTIDMCNRAVALITDVAASLDLAKARRSAGDATGARATIVAAEARLAQLPAARARRGWLVLAQHYRDMDALTWAEAAVAKAGVGPDEDHGIAAWATMTRVRFGLPRDGAPYKLAPADEPAALAAVRAVLARTNAGRFADAAKAARAAERRWPALPGVLAARCDLELRRGAHGAARGLCTRASAHDGSSWALYLGAILELQHPGAAATRRGIAELRHAIAIDPGLGQAWRALGQALARAKATTELDQLRKDYQARFGEPLP